MLGELVVITHKQRHHQRVHRQNKQGKQRHQHNQYVSECIVEINQNQIHIETQHGQHKNLYEPDDRSVLKVLKELLKVCPDQGSTRFIDNTLCYIVVCGQSGTDSDHRQAAQKRHHIGDDQICQRVEKGEHRVIHVNDSFQNSLPPEKC